MTNVGLLQLLAVEDDDWVGCCDLVLDIVETKADCVLLDGNDLGRGVIDILGCWTVLLLFEFC